MDKNTVMLYTNSGNTENSATADKHNQVEQNDEQPSKTLETSPLSENLDRGEEADGESDMSDLDQNPPQAQSSSVGVGSKKRRKANPLKRKKIRKLLTEDKLSHQTILAVQEEELRRKRLEEQSGSKELSPGFKPAQFFATSPPSGGTSSYLADLLTSTDRNDDATKPLSKPTPKCDVICISSDSSDEDKRKQGADAIDVSSDNSSDDVICTGEIKDEEPEVEDTNNSGTHIDDTLNQPDSQGRVLVNVKRPTNEPEIFLAPQLAKAVHPHQIGGIRFIFDNVVETLSHHETNPGFGCILAHAMGLGKTLQVISFLDVYLRYTNARTALCVVPVNTLMNWVSEFDKWLPLKSKCVNDNPALLWPRAFTVHVLTESHKSVESRSKVISQWYEEGGVLLLGYEMYRLLASRKSRKTRKKNKKKNLVDTIDLDEQDRISNLQTGMQDSLLQPGPDLIICDEGHRIKNSGANISKVLKSLRTRRRLVLTGYPLQNNLMEYWCMVDFVRPNFLGTKSEFSNMFERPILNGQCADSTVEDIRLMRYRSHVLHNLLKGFVQRRSQSVLRNTLPLKEEHIIMIRLSPWQKKLYNTFIKMNVEGGSGSWTSTTNPIRAFSICCKIWNHPDVLYRTVCEKTDKQEEDDFDLPDSITGGIQKDSKNRKPSPNGIVDTLSTGGANGPGMLPTPSSNSFSDDKEKGISYEWAKELLSGYNPGFVHLSGKMEIVMQIIRTSVSIGDKLLVFSQSLSTLSLIEEFLKTMSVPGQEPKKWEKNQSYFRLDGNTHSADRERMINHFNSPENKHVWLFLLSTRAGCLGINLIGANRVVVFDVSWNPCHDAQAVCRVYRYGQQKNCFIYRLVCDQTMEKKIYERQITKQGMSDRVVDKLNPTSVFTKQDVIKLLEYSDVELPSVVFEPDEITSLHDLVLNETCSVGRQWMTQKPFQHESLLLDCKDQRLTKAEMRIAQKGYERDKLASSTFNYSRPSYAGFYGSSSIVKSSSTNSLGSTFNTNMPRDGFRPIANVRPMQTTPFPRQLNSGSNVGPSITHKSGVTVQRVVASQEIPLPPIKTPGLNTTPQTPSSIKVGETYCVIMGKKGTYIRTITGRTFAVKSHEEIRINKTMTSSHVSSSSQSGSQMTSSQEVPNFRRNQSEPNMRQDLGGRNFANPQTSNLDNRPTRGFPSFPVTSQPINYSFKQATPTSSTNQITDNLFTDQIFTSSTVTPQGHVADDNSLSALMNDFNSNSNIFTGRNEIGQIEGGLAPVSTSVTSPELSNPLFYPYNYSQTGSYPLNGITNTPSTGSNFEFDSFSPDSFSNISSDLPPANQNQDSFGSASASTQPCEQFGIDLSSSSKRQSDFSLDF